MGGGGSQTTKMEPYGPAIPSLNRGLGMANTILDQRGFAPSPYEGDRVANMNIAQTTGMGNALDVARGGQPVIDAASGALTGMMGGQSANLDAVKRNALGSAVPAAMSMFAGNGMTDSSQAMDTVGRAAAEAVAPYEYDAWNQSQQRSLQAAALAPGAAQAEYMPAQMQMQIGGMQQQQRQAEMDAVMSRYLEKENFSADNLRNYASLIGGFGGMGGTQTAPGASTGSKIAGAGLTGLGAYGALSSLGAAGPVGGGIAGLLALSSLF